MRYYAVRVLGQDIGDRQRDNERGPASPRLPVLAVIASAHVCLSCLAVCLVCGNQAAAAVVRGWAHSSSSSSLLAGPGVVDGWMDGW